MITLNEYKKGLTGDPLKLHAHFRSSDCWDTPTPPDQENQMHLHRGPFTHQITESTVTDKK